MTAGWLVGPSGGPTAHTVHPGLGVTEDTLLPLLQLDLTGIDHGRADWPDQAVLLGYDAYTYQAAGEISTFMPSFTYWLYWSPRTKTFAQIDEHD